MGRRPRLATGDERAADAAVAVEKKQVDRFSNCACASPQRTSKGQAMATLMQKFSRPSSAFIGSCGGGAQKLAVIQGAASAAVQFACGGCTAQGFLAAANLAATAVHISSAWFRESGADSGSARRAPPSVHGAHVVEDFFHVLRRVVGGGSGLECQHVFKRALRAFDLRRQHGFVPHIHGDEQVGVGQLSAMASSRARSQSALESQVCSSPSKTIGGSAAAARHLEGAVASGLLDVTAGAVGWGGHGVRLNRSALGCILFKKTQFG